MQGRPDGADSGLAGSEPQTADETRSHPMTIEHGFHATMTAQPGKLARILRPSAGAVR